MNIMIIDNETAPIHQTEEVNPNNMLTYDSGFVIMNPRTGEVLTEGSYIIKQIFYNQKLMQSAYYASKLPKYREDIANKKRIVIDWFEYIELLNDLYRKYNIVAICAHNAKFDVAAMNNTMRWLTFNEVTRALPDVEIWDSMLMAQSTIATYKSYRKFCIENNYLTKHFWPQPKLTAEVLYRYIANNNNFVESHTALEDVYIESEIVKKCFSTHKKMKRILYHKVD